MLKSIKSDMCHFGTSVKVRTFVALLIMEEVNVQKVIDENRQGEALMIKDNGDKQSKKLYLESYGCQMNFSDSEIVASVLTNAGFSTTRNYEEADLILLNTCAIRDNAEQRVRNKLNDFRKSKKKNPGLIIGIMGCMAERLKSNLLEEEKLVDIVVGPDAYRELPSLVKQVEGGQKAVNVLLSREETYADINPVRLDSNGVTAFISIMRGCDNMCSFCVVPFTRGRERSRDPQSILHEAKYLFENGYREVTLLGQNVDSYKWNMNGKGEILDAGKPTTNFAQLMEMVAQVSPDLRIRFSTSHPKDMTDDVLEIMAKYENICEYVHLPVQSGNTNVLERMNRGYSREWYLDRIKAIRKFMPDAAISTDIITGFCGETDDEHADTVSLMKEVNFDYAYMFAYSERPKTLAQRKYTDDVPNEIKTKRLNEVQALQQSSSLDNNKKYLGKTYKVLIEGVSKKSKDELCGRTTHNAMVVFPKENFEKGQYVHVKIESCTPATLIGRVVSGV